MLGREDNIILDRIFAVEYLLGGHTTLTAYALSSWSHTQFARLRA